VIQGGVEQASGFLLQETGGGTTRRRRSSCRASGRVPRRIRRVSRGLTRIILLG